MEYPWLREADIDAAARDLLDRALGPTRDRRCPDLEAVIFDYLAEQDQLSFDNDADLESVEDELVLGKTLPLAGKILISRLLQSPAERGRYRFTVAHELGHWILHRRLFLAAAQAPDLFATVDDSFAFVSLDRTTRPDAWGRKGDRPEWQANRFASAVLVDPDALREEFAGRFGQAVVPWNVPEWRRRSGTLRAHARLLATSSEAGRLPLAEAFGLSAEAMAVTLEAKGYAIAERPLL